MQACMEMKLILQRYLRNREKGVSIQVPGLHGFLMVLKDDFNEVAEGELEHNGPKVDLVERVDVGWGVITNNIVFEHLIGHSKILSELHRGVRIHMGGAIDGIPELSIGCTSCVSQPDCTSDGD